MRRTVTGLFVFGSPLVHINEEIEIPQELIEYHESIYRVGADFQDYRAGDLFIVEHRKDVSTGEFVLATFKDNAYVGNWWAKHKKRELWIDQTTPPMRGVEIAGVINQVVRL
jgi:SOS-response transcriptional repressor LexA